MKRNLILARFSSIRRGEYHAKIHTSTRVMARVHCICLLAYSLTHSRVPSYLYSHTYYDRTATTSTCALSSPTPASAPLRALRSGLPRCLHMSLTCLRTTTTQASIRSNFGREAPTRRRAAAAVGSRGKATNEAAEAAAGIPGRTIADGPAAAALLPAGARAAKKEEPIGAILTRPRRDRGDLAEEVVR